MESGKYMMPKRINHRFPFRTAFGIMMLLTALTLEASAVPIEEWNRTYGGANSDGAHSVEVAQNRYILAGFTNSFGAGGSDAWLITIDADGNEEWNRTFGGPRNEEFWSVRPISDGYILAGSTRSFGAGGSDAWLIKSDSDGNEEWNKTFGGINNDFAYSVQQTSDDGFIIAGETASFGAGGFDAWLIKTDENGNESWNRTFGGVLLDRAQSVQETSDGYVIAGVTRLFGADNTDAWLIKTRLHGEEEWNRRFGGINNDFAYSVQKISDGYILAGSTGSYGAGDFDVWLIKIDSDGDEEWNRTFGGSGFDEARSVLQTPDGYILAGSTDSYGVGGSDAWLIKTDLDGDEEWNRTFGGSGRELAWSVRKIAGGFVLAGSTDSYGAGGLDAWLINISSPEEPTPVPPGIPGKDEVKAKGKGWIVSPSPPKEKKNKAKFDFDVKIKKGKLKGKLKYDDQAIEMKVKSMSVTELIVDETNNKAIFNGSAKIMNAAKVTTIERYTVVVWDNSKKGKGIDRFNITLLDSGYTANGTLMDGNIKIDP